MADTQINNSIPLSDLSLDGSSQTSFNTIFGYQMPKFIAKLLWIFGGALLISFFIYILSIIFTPVHNFDKGRAIDFLTTTKTVLNAQKSPLTSIDYGILKRRMYNAVNPKFEVPVNLDLFVNISPVSDSLYNNFNAIEVDTLVSGLTRELNTDFRRLDGINSYYYKRFGYNFYKYDLSQFISNTDTGNEIEDVAKYCCIFLFVIFSMVISLTYFNAIQQRQHFDREMRYQTAIKTSSDITESWVTAQTTLDTYHQRNLDQNNWTFRLSVIVMGIGFAIIFYGIHSAISLNAIAKGPKDSNNGTSLIAIISTASGVIINLIGGTFLAIYNSTLKQAIDYTNSLQKTSTVGTSLAILKSIEDAQKADERDPLTLEKLVDAKIAIAKQLTGTPSS
ncbi:TRADD-N-associated membrane domain-containing protein [Mucilaginibacter sp. X4EP1]|uniref:TRADD-N-associated membrane domain-containing protein n=1 Tax=Mucilaginibacter sp. X4EP1 TaxID=2723092 RepID=UPI00216A13FA|nr:hypothetical protein [Mucilaginibacter sp. X4EP1]MCS3812725.1 hypothetical protein [Mucilaginibacter sp. X4EP1]